MFGCDVENDGEEMEVELAAWWVTMLVETGASVAAAAPEVGSLVGHDARGDGGQRGRGSAGSQSKAEHSNGGSHQGGR